MFDPSGPCPAVGGVQSFGAVTRHWSRGQQCLPLSFPGLENVILAWDPNRELICSQRSMESLEALEGALSFLTEQSPMVLNVSTVIRTNSTVIGDWRAGVRQYGNERTIEIWELET